MLLQAVLDIYLPIEGKDHKPRCTCGGHRTPCQRSSPCRFWGLNLGHQAWQQAPLPTKSSHPCIPPSFKTSFQRYTLYVIKSTHSIYVLRFSVHLKNCTIITLTQFQITSITPQVSQVLLPAFPTAILHNCSSFFLYNLPFLNILCNTRYDILSLISCLEMKPYHGICQ